MPETPAAVTDTHPLLFHAAGTGKLGKAAKAHFDACERREAMIYVPMVVIWECALLAGAARINLRRSVRAFFDDLFSNPAYQPYDLTLPQVLARTRHGSIGIRSTAWFAPRRATWDCRC